MCVVSKTEKQNFGQKSLLGIPKTHKSLCASKRMLPTVDNCYFKGQGRLQLLLPGIILRH